MVETVRARPRKAAIVCWIAAIAVVVIFSAVAAGLRGSEGRVVFGLADQLAMVGFGLLGAAAILSFTRPRVEADTKGIRIRNVVGSYDLPWEVVRSVQFGRGSPWASLELQDDDVVAVMAIQAADKEYAVEAVRQVRALLAVHQKGRQPDEAGSDGGLSAG